MKTEIATIRGLKTGWLRYPSAGRPFLIFLHGYPDSAETWTAQAAHFADRFEVICPYIRGAEPSEPARVLSRYGRKAVALDILQILKRLDPLDRRPIYCVGHDLGAVHASYLGSLLGKRLVRLALLGGLPLETMAGRMKDMRQQLKSWYIYGMQIPFVADWLAPRLVPKVAERLGRLPASVEPTAAGEPLNQYRAFARELPRLGVPPMLEAPVLILAGRDDKFLVPPREIEFSRWAPRLQTRILDGNHWLHRENPARVNRILESFFDD